MPEPLARLVVLAVEVYAATGAIFAAAFIARGVDMVDARAGGAGWGFRLLIFPGCVLFWPLLVRRWVQARRAS
jgi:hypothetical protein